MVLIRKYFLVAALITAIIFILGVIVGVQLDTMKLNTIQDRYKQTELDWYDMQIKSDYYKLYPGITDYCEIMIDSNLEFSDEIYSQGLEIERYEEQSKFLEAVKQDKREYALLKFQFWMNAIELRDSCRADYDIILYFYKDEPNAIEEVKQNAMSNVLFNLKQNRGPKVILVPLPIDLDIESINLVTKQFSIHEVPSIVINEKETISGVLSQTAITQALNKASVSTVA
jgi:hypothetical protein